VKLFNLKTINMKNIFLLLASIILLSCTSDDPENDQTIPVLTTSNVINVTLNTAMSGGNITSNGGADITARGVVWSTSQNPTIALTTKTVDGTGSGSFTSSISGLTPNTIYYLRAYATNSVGTAYGNEVTFTTSAIQLPVITTSAISNITQNTASSGGNITSDGGGAITVRGVVWSTSQNPTVALLTKTTDGSGISPFTSSISGLTPNTIYYVRAYATNSTGTAYGNEVNFTTLTPNNAAMYPTGTVFCNNVITAVVNVTNPVTGKIWMDRNLGASRVALNITDEQALGDLYQWGRGADGHQCRNSAVIFTLSSSDQPGHSNFISRSNLGDWRNPQNPNLWQGVNGINNPCPNGYRIPTKMELIQEYSTWGGNDANAAFSSFLRILKAGVKSSTWGSISPQLGDYWCSTVEVGAGNSQYMRISNPGVSIEGDDRAAARSVRCIKN
jgi:hypothetical protein